MRYKIFIVLILIAVVVSGCTNDPPVKKENVSLEIGYEEAGGTVEVEGEQAEPGEEFIFEEGSEVTLEAIPKEDFSFTKWVNINNSNKKIDILMNEDMQIVAEFFIPLVTELEAEHEEGEEVIVDRLNVETLDAYLVKEGKIIKSKQKQLKEFPGKYEIGFDVEEKAVYDLFVKKRGTVILENEVQTLYKGEKKEVELEPDKEDKVKIKARPVSAKSLTVKLNSPEDALKNLDKIEIEHASLQPNRQAIKEYDGTYSEGVVTFDDGNEYNGKELDMRPGSWELSLIFGGEESNRIDVEELILLPREEKVIELEVYREEGDLEVKIDWELPPPAPENVNAEKKDNGVEVDWNEVEEAVSYNIVRKEPYGRDYWQVIETDITNPPFTENDLTNGVVYEYAVVAVNEDGLTSDYSEPTNEISF